MAADTGSKQDKTKGQGDEETSPEVEVVEGDDLLARCQELESKALRAHADYQNLRRRAQADLEAGIKHQMQPLLEELLLVLDFLDMALACPATNEETKNLAVGVEMTRNKFVQALEGSDVLSIDTSGKFDPALHEASEAVEDPDREPGTILATLRRGYKWHEQVLRPAQVKVVAGELKHPEPNDDEAEAPEPGADDSPTPQQGTE